MIETHVHLAHRVESGELNTDQANTLRPFIVGRHVHDLGAGDFRLTTTMLDMGARFVTAIDKGYTSHITERWPTSDYVQIVGAWFHQYKPPNPIEVALVSWPTPLYLWPSAPEYIQGLIDLCAAAPVVAYLGSNFGSFCGNLELWRHFGTREVLAYSPNRRNSLIVYGRDGGRCPGQGQLAEERAALYRHVDPLPEYAE